MRSRRSSVKQRLCACFGFALLCCGVMSASVAEAGNLYWVIAADDNDLFRFDLDDPAVTEAEKLGAIEDGVATDMELDLKNGLIYWSMAGEGFNKIYRVELGEPIDGETADILVESENGIQSIALDVEGGTVYWSEVRTEDRLHLGSIKRMSMDEAGSIETLIAENFGLKLPKGLALDLQGGKMYWADEQAHSIGKANLNGTDANAIVLGDGDFWPQDIALDVDNGKIYWSETYWARQIQVASLDGEHIETILSAGADFSGIDLDLGARELYFAFKTGQGAIYKIDMDARGLRYEDLPDPLITGIHSPQEVALDFQGTAPPPVEEEWKAGQSSTLDMSDETLSRKVNVSWICLVPAGLLLARFRRNRTSSGKHGHKTL